jgi:hypothetical protein
MKRDKPTNPDRTDDRHPARQTLASFLQGALPPPAAKRTVAHLLGDCAPCRTAAEPFAEPLFKPGRNVPEISREMDNAYEDAISAAFAKALESERLLVRQREGSERKVEELLAALDRGEQPRVPSATFCTWALCEHLLEKSWDLRGEDPSAMLRTADVARQVAEKLDPAAYGHAQVADLHARTWAALANAYRLTDQLQNSEAAMAWATELRRHGTGDPLLLARIADLSASLYCDMRRFPETFRALDTAYALYRSHGESHDAGRVLVMKGLYSGYAGEYEAGLQFLVQGLTVIDRERDPKLVLHALNNILLFRVELGDFVGARRQLERMHPLNERQVTALEGLRLRWIEGKIAAGLSELESAEAAFLEARRASDEAGQGYQAALISLDLAALRISQGKTAEVPQIVAEVLATFGALGVEREAMTAVLMLKEAVERDQATLEIIRGVSSVLQRLRSEPAPRVGNDRL